MFGFQFIASLCGIAWTIAWQGLTLSILWGWFISKLFQLPEISIASACGLVLVIAAAKGFKLDSSKDDTTALIVKAFIIVPILCGVMLLAGLIVKGLA